ncbi:rhodanese-like domain-containing protein [candidate division KSB3 bacterium]|uniref:Rhodanese-like domain-containing protein n=1 Tax=candidate division KSB3 bacterium TaxID=2044937 RepID=A0A9D5JUY3_9BACT|nr:rhodanese-like domain-containing protein [candidate division KSB3 bacterium]MBD3324131.1 rhodanese-like domain-containing protein [candidate division KSB3 bacterium]
MHQFFRTYRPMVFFLIILIGMIGLDLWQRSDAEESAPNVHHEQILQDIAPQEAQALIQEHQGEEDFVILDVRTPREFEGGRLEQAVNLDYYSENFREALNKLDKDKMYLVYCRSGSRSRQTLRLMEDLNFSHAYNLSGGILRWHSQGLPVVQ